MDNYQNYRDLGKYDNIPADGTFEEWCDFCNTITDHAYIDDDCETIKCLDCGIED